ncbi:hypothetical protein IEC33019_1888 [Pseudomonas putida]|uniref:Uncharacterized protein n=3 Tax=Pseudomonas TaxID=286 RepID=A0A1B2F581_PSEPU|nr:hypothetical protein IEC33019_1888 [Pseudomonas putida]
MMALMTWEATMKKCVVYGDLLSDRAAEQYPTITLCDGCIEDDRRAGEVGQILFVQGEAEEDVCDWCAGEPGEC